MDPDLVPLLAAGIDHSITIRLSSEVTRVPERPGGGFMVHVRDGGTEAALGTDLVLVAVGRRPVIHEGATDLSLPMTGHGLAAEPSMQIPGHPHLYAPGDGNSSSMLFHSAESRRLLPARD